MLEAAIDLTQQFILTIALTILGIIVAIAIPVIIYLKQRSRKVFSFKLLSVTPLLSVNKELKGKIKITYESKPVEDVNLVLVEFFNSGNKEILDTDYIDPISVFFGKESQILLSEVVEVKPSPFKISANTDGMLVTLSKTTLNAGDSVTIKALVTKLECVLIGGRITGGKIEQSIPTTQTPDFWSKMGIIVFLIATIGMFVSYAYDQILLLGFFALLFLLIIGLTALYVIAKLYVFIYSKLRHKSNSD